MVIAIDGPAGSGKSTLAKLTAKKLNINYLNTGMIFRAIAYYLIQNNIDAQNDSDVSKSLNKINMQIDYVSGEQIINLNGFDITNKLSSPQISNLASSCSQMVCVREFVCRIQRDFAEKNDIVVEGRDIGTTVFPDAKYKFFVTASLEKRAERRYNSLLNKTSELTYEKVKKLIQERDVRDTTREISPLIMAKDAILIDTSNDTIEQSLNKIISKIKY